MFEKLEAVAIIRNGKLCFNGARSHYDLRASLGDVSPSFGQSGDDEGFVTNFGRFVNREEAKHVAIASGQLHPRWEKSQRALLSSDINW